MSPPGRRKLPLPLSLPTFILLLLTLTHTASAAASILGIDLGTSYLKAVLVKPGIPLEIVLSKDSKRKEAAAVAFKPAKTGAVPSGQFPERAYGPDALALAARFPGDVYPNLKPLLGKIVEGGNTGSGDGDVVRVYGTAHPALRVKATEERGTVGFQSGAFGEGEREWSVEELLGMELKNLRGNAEAMAKSKVSDAVITIPAFWTARERSAVQLAAKLAGLEVVALISDGLAVGMNYAMSRTLKVGGKPEYHMVFDMGAGSTTATVLKFQAKEVKDVGRWNRTIHELTVLGSGWDQTLGGDALDTLIFENMVEKFLDSTEGKKLNTDAAKVRSHGRASAKLLKEAVRVRQVLSANNDIGASFESLYEDVDFRYKLSRTDFEKMAETFNTRLDHPIKTALDAAKLTFDDLDSVILHGGASRTPFVQKTLEKLAGDASKLRSNVNADEAAVFGAAFKGAALSPSFRVKEIWDNDSGSYAINIKWTYDGKERKQKIFTPTSLVGSVPKQVPFKNLQDFDVSFFQQVPSASDASVLEDAPVLKIETKNLTASVEKLEKLGCTKDTISTVLSFRLDAVDGLPEVVSGSVSCEVEEPEKKGSIADGVKGLFGFGDKKDQKVLKDDEKSNTETATESAEASSAETSASSTSSGDAKATDTTKKDEKEAAGPKKRTETIMIEIKSTKLGFEQPSSKELSRMKKRLAAYDAADEARRDHEESLNSLESYIYRARDLLTQESFTEYMKPEELKAAQELTDTSGEWISSEGPKSELKVLKEKLKALKNAIDPVNVRKEEFATRGEAVKLLDDTFNRTANLRDAMQREVDEVAAKSASEAEASSSSAEAAASSSATATETSENLEADETTSTTSSSASATPSSTYTDDYTTSDVFVIGVAYDNIMKWYTETKEAQDKLTKTDDPVLLTADINQRVGELNDVMWQMVQKKITFNGGGKQQKPKKSSSKKTKKSTKSKSSSSKTKGAKSAAKETASAGSEKLQSVKDKVTSKVEEILEEASAVPKHEEL